MATIEMLLARRNGPNDLSKRERTLKDIDARMEAMVILSGQLKGVLTCLGQREIQDLSHFERNLYFEFEARVAELEDEVNWRRCEQVHLNNIRNDDLGWEPRCYPIYHHGISARRANEFEGDLDQSFREEQIAMVQTARGLDDPTSVLAMIWQLLDSISHDSLDQFGAYDDLLQNIRDHRGRETMGCWPQSDPTEPVEPEPDTLSASRTRLKRALIKASRAAWILPEENGDTYEDSKTLEFHDGQIITESTPESHLDCSDLTSLTDEGWKDSMSDPAEDIRLWDPFMARHANVGSESMRLFNLFRIRSGQAAMDYIFPRHADVP